MSRNIDLSPVLSGPVTPTSSAVVDLVRTMEQLDAAYERVRGRDPTDEEDRLISKLDDRREVLQDQIKREVKDALGVDWDILYMALA